MKTQEKKPEAVSHTLQAKSGKTHQPPATAVLQAYKEGIIQREADEEEEPLQMKPQQSPANAAVLQAYKEGVVQRETEEEEEPLQMKSQQSPASEAVLQAYKGGVVQREAEEEEEPLQMKSNQTGLPDNLKSGVEALSGYSMDDVRVHFNSSQPAQFKALAYTQGSHIHVAPGQEQHLPHEAWHVVQQKQGRVQPTMQMKGVQVNDDQGLEREADEMGGRALTYHPTRQKAVNNYEITLNSPIQRRPIPLGTNDNYFNAFASQSYKRGYKNIAGHFLVSYTPMAKQLLITLPVFFIPKEYYANNTVNFRTQRALSDNERELFKRVVHQTWSNKHAFKTTATTHKARENKWDWLNNVSVMVRVEETPDAASAFFRMTGNNKLSNSSVNPFAGHVTLSSSAYNETKHYLGENNNLLPNSDTDNSSRTHFNNQYNVYAHEAGHMLGLDDEYQVTVESFFRRIRKRGFKVYDVVANKMVSNDGRKNFKFMYATYRIHNGVFQWYNKYEKKWGNCAPLRAIKGTATTHYELTRHFLGEKYADTHAVMNNETSGETIMGAGNQVKKHHYVTFLHALIVAIQTVYGTNPSFRAPNQTKDWTFAD
ncbi:DUF4157 domain-containing protein [Parabacteroides sp. OttesenSCG-928-J18]|nr:DUF4157 domain-containing protein [Parabacteroides sp. OttesenSCG-928-J18]